MIKPQNFEEVVRLKKCLQMSHYIQDKDDALLEKIFAHLADPKNRILLTKDPSGEGCLLFYGANDYVEQTERVSIAGTILSATLTAAAFQASFPRMSSGGGGDAGISGNNNNNNNNNNNA